MANSSFTKEELLQLKSNPYTNWATENMISFTKEFKQEFWNRYQSGMKPRDIVSELGYDPDVLGESRITGIQGNIKKTALSGKEFTNAPIGGMPAERLTSIEFDPTKETIIKMQNEILFLQQEIEFLKKISSVRNTKK